MADKHSEGQKDRHHLSITRTPCTKNAQNTKIHPTVTVNATRVSVYLTPGYMTGYCKPSVSHNLPQEEKKLLRLFFFSQWCNGGISFCGVWCFVASLFSTFRSNVSPSSPKVLDPEPSVETSGTQWPSVARQVSMESISLHMQLVYYVFLFVHAPTTRTKRPVAEPVVRRLSARNWTRFRNSSIHHQSSEPVSPRYVAFTVYRTRGWPPDTQDLWEDTDQRVANSREGVI